jgi:hypothetical protein
MELQHDGESWGRSQPILGSGGARPPLMRTLRARWTQFAPNSTRYAESSMLVSNEYGYEQ